MGKNSLLSVHKISKKYLNNGIECDVLSGVSFEIRENETASIVGESGCGKSTLFDIISGLCSQDEGSIFINGEEINNRKGRFGYLLQNPSLLPWLDSLDNVSISYRLKGEDIKSSRKKALSLFHKFNLQKIIHLKPDFLSGGMKQRVAFLRTIAYNSKFLILDEPFQSLDQITKLRTYDFLIEARKVLNLTILISTHDIREAVRLSHKVMVLGGKPAKIIREIQIKGISSDTDSKILKYEKIIAELIDKAA